MEFAKITSGGTVSAYPYAERDIRAAHPNTSFPRDLSMADLEDFNIVNVHPVEAPVPAPDQEVVTTAIYDYEAGIWRQSHALNELSLAAKATKLASAKEFVRLNIDRIASNKIALGYQPATGPMAGHTLQVRNLEDRTNWLTSQASYSTAVAMGHGAVEGANFRTAANATVTLSYADGLSVLIDMAAWGAAIMGHSWTLKDAATAAISFAALGDVDLESGWPA